MNRTPDPIGNLLSGLEFVAIYDDVRPWGVSFVIRLGVPEYDADFVLRGALLSFPRAYLRDLEKYRRLLIHRIRCRCWSYYRHAKKREAGLSRFAEELQAQTSAAPATPWDNEPSEELQRALDRLNPLDRQILHLLYWDDLSVQAIAALLNLSVNTVKSRAHRARCRLHLMLKGTPRRSKRMRNRPQPACGFMNNRAKQSPR